MENYYFLAFRLFQHKIASGSDFGANLALFWFPKPIKIVSWRRLEASWGHLEASWSVLGSSRGVKECMDRRKTSGGRPGCRPGGSLQRPDREGTAPARIRHGSGPRSPVRKFEYRYGFIFTMGFLIFSPEGLFHGYPQSIESINQSIYSINLINLSNQSI